MDAFYQALNAEQKQFFDLYKSNGPYLDSDHFATTLNNNLRENTLPDEWQHAVAILDELILLNKLTEDRTFYRATFLEHIKAHRINNQIIFSSFISTGEDTESVKTHFRTPETWNTPALLKIHCPVGTSVAPLENSMTSGMEKENLLSRNLAFIIEKEEIVTDRQKMNALMDPDIAADFDQLYLITLRLTTVNSA